MADQDKNNVASNQSGYLKTLAVRRMDGTETGEKVNLDQRLFGLEPNDHVLYLAVKCEMTNKRQGNHSTRNRALVSGGGRKPWKQKGRGGARAGTIRSPLWKGGGTVFGPETHDHYMQLPRKVKRLARKIAFSTKAQTDAIEIVEDLKIDEPKTSRIAGMLQAFSLGDTSTLILTADSNISIVKSCRNIPRLEVRECLSASTVDILKAKKLLISRSALDRLVGGLVDA